MASTAQSWTWAEKYWEKWYFWATHSQLEPIKRAAKTLKEHHYGWNYELFQ
ncbi:MAG TPA: hypothetical protein ENH40_02050 [Nitrospirae bacterium]|nr:hypothetical protein [Nitrospirota bacterium]